MSTFRYTVNQDYNEFGSFQGYYTLLGGDGQLTTSGATNVFSVDRIYIEPDYYEGMAERISNGYNLLTNIDGRPLDVYASGFNLDYSDKSNYININGWMYGDYIYAGSGNDYLSGYDGSDHLYGNDGNDILDGGAGADILYGGTGINTASYSSARSGVTVDLNLQGVAQVSSDDANGDILFNISNLAGGFSNDTLIGDAEANTLMGFGGNDILWGNGGNDLFNGGEGADVIDGGDGTNTASYEDSRFNVTVNLNLGNAAQISAGDANGDTLFNIQNLVGSRYADILTGDTGVNVLTGNAGDDTLRGMGGADTLIGGDGSDRLVITGTPTLVDGGDGADVLFVFGTDLGDTVTLTDINFTGIEKVYVRTDTTLDMSNVGAGVTIVSQSTDQHFVDITGTSGDDIISAGKGFDQIHGGAGDDVIKGGNGIGPAGASVLYGDAGNDVITAGKGIALIYGGDGNDTLKGASGVGLLSGGDGNDRIIAGARGFDIDGGEGTDRLFAGAGDDTFHFAGNFGRDEIYKFDLAHDTLDVSAFATDFNGLKISSVHNGADTQITFVGDADPTHKIILHDVTKADLIDQGHFTFGA